jgi:hypothetical protein
MFLLVYLFYEVRVYGLLVLLPLLLLLHLFSKVRVE